MDKFDVEPKYDDDGVQATSGIGQDGLEYPDPVPMAPPVGYVPPADLMTMIKRMVHSELASTVLAAADVETFEEADDFDIEDDPIDPLTEYEKVFLPVPSPVETAPAAPAVKSEPAVASPPADKPAPSAQSST